jgi:hypothetical protein
MMSWRGYRRKRPWRILRYHSIYVGSKDTLEKYLLGYPNFGLSMQMTVLWDAAPCSLVEVNPHNDGGSKHV